MFNGMFVELQLRLPYKPFYYPFLFIMNNSVQKNIIFLLVMVVQVLLVVITVGR